MRKALITGLNGQDGYYLAKLLLDKGYEVHGLSRTVPSGPDAKPLLDRGLMVHQGDITNEETLGEVLRDVQPDEVYNLAALSSVSESFKKPDETFRINYNGFENVLDLSLKVNPFARIYQASTSEMYGETPPPQNENSPLKPVSPYAESKARAHTELVKKYRNEKDAHVSSGILFNHESPKRPLHFVTRKITHTLAQIKTGLTDELVLGNLSAERDWGFAGDYVEAMWLMLQQATPDDYVIATGKSRTVRDFVQAAAKALEMDLRWEGAGVDEVGLDTKGNVLVRVSPEFFRPVEFAAARGDTTKARTNLGWIPKTSFEDMLKIMIEHEMKLLQY